MPDEKNPNEPPDENQPVDEKTTELVSYLDGEMDPDEADELEAQIGRDQKLRREADSLKRAWDMLDFLPRPEPSANFTEKTISQIMPLQNAPATGSSLTRASSLVPPRPSSSSVAVVPAAPPAKPLNRKLLLALSLLAVALGWFLQRPIQKAFQADDSKNNDAQLLSEIRLLKNLKYYRQIEDFSFLQALDTPELFAEETTTRE
jgi:hypothetical protein